MKQWDASERGGHGLDGAGKVKCRDTFVYRRLRNTFFSKQFMVDHWYVPERDRQLPHVAQPYKVCKSCGASRRNDFKAFTKEVYGDKKLGRYTTGDVCRICVSAAMQRSRQARTDLARLASAQYIEHGDEMWEAKYGTERS